MSKTEAKKAAQKFLEDSARIIGKYGEEPKLSGEHYEKVLADTQKTFQSLSSARQS